MLPYKAYHITIVMTIAAPGNIIPFCILYQLDSSIFVVKGSHACVPRVLGKVGWTDRDVDI